MSLPEPQFIDRDPEVIEREIFELFESLANETLSPTQPEALLLRVLAYRETLLRIGVQEAAKQNLLRFAKFPMLDYIGELVGTPRLDAQAATTTIKFTLPAVHGSDVIFIGGTRRKSKDGKVTFSTDDDATILTGELTVQVKATATVAGEVGNGYLAGQVATEVDPLPQGATAENVTTSGAGAAQETDLRYLERILLAPDAYSTAGSEEAYRYHALTASALVVDVAVTSAVSGEIDITALEKSGVPSQETLDAITAKVSAKKVRPMSDTVSVAACTESTWTLTAALTLYADADDDETLAAAEQSAEEFTAKLRARLGRDAVLNQIVNALTVPGVFDLTISAPASSIVVTPTAWSNCTGITITIAAHSDELMVVE